MRAADFNCAQGHLALRAGWLVDGAGGPVQADQLITVSSGRFHRICSYADTSTQNQDVIDLSDCTIIPALMDVHVHLTFSGTRDPRAREQQLRHRVEEAHRAIAKHLDETLHCGVVAVRHAGDRRGDLLQWSAVADIPVVVKSTGWAWHAAGRYGRMIGHSPPGDAGLKRAVASGLPNLDHIKILNSGINSIDHFGDVTPPQFPSEDLAQLCRYAQLKRRPVMVHANGSQAVKESIEAGCDSIEHGYFMGSENLLRLADNGITWVPTVTPMAALARCGAVPSRQADVVRRNCEQQLKQIQQAHQMGVAIALGTDAGSPGVDHGVAVWQELAYLMEAGLPVGDAVGCATMKAAHIMGLERRGGIRPGFHADFIALRGMPGKSAFSPGNLVLVCIGGKLVNTVIRNA